MLLKIVCWIKIFHRWNGTFQSGHSTLKINEVKIVFSQPLLKGTLCARLRALKHAHVPHPYTGNVYMVQGMVAFTGGISLWGRRGCVLVFVKKTLLNFLFLKKVEKTLVFKLFQPLSAVKCWLELKCSAKLLFLMCIGTPCQMFLQVI